MGGMNGYFLWDFAYDIYGNVTVVREPANNTIQHYFNKKYLEGSSFSKQVTLRLQCLIIDLMNACTDCLAGFCSDPEKYDYYKFIKSLTYLILTYVV